MSWIIYAGLSAIFAALVAIFGKIGLSKVDTTLAATIRAVIMALFLVMTTFSLGKIKFIQDVDNKALVFIIFSGVAGALSWLFYFFALKNGPASGVVSIDRLSVVFVLILAVLFLGESFTWKTGLGALFFIAGAILIYFK